ncbi:MAG: hypothetical protein JXA09_03685 [Anaerolineae bacterium]|nr:hypothetical protein [Anaerolineae bacterium]
MTRTRCAMLAAACALLAAGVLLAAGASAAANDRESPTAVDATLASLPTLANPGFEEPYAQWDGLTDCAIAHGWSMWYVSGGDWHRDPPRAEANTQYVREGSVAQLLRSDDFRTFDACLYQQVSGVTPGHYVRFGVWARTDSSLAPDKRGTQIGIDPSGGADPLAIRDQELLWDRLTAASGEWQRLSIAVRAISETVTLYACARPLEPWDQRFLSRWDDASLAVVAPTHAYFPLILAQHFAPPPGSLWNPDLEQNWGLLAGYQPYPGYESTIRTAPYWLPFWNDDYDPATGENKQPEYGYPRDAPHRVRTGEASQQYGLSGWGGFEAGIYQVVSGTTPGATYQFTMWGMGWCSLEGGSEDYSDLREGLNFRVGIDPYGGDAYTSGEIVWSETGDPYDAWASFTVTATAQSDQISVWAYAHPLAYWARFNQVFWDSGSLTLLDAP